MIPSAIERKAGLGTSITAESEISTVSPEKRTALPAESIVTAMARGRELRPEEGAAEAVNDEERVVDSERKREHEREIHRPDRDLEAVREQRSRPAEETQAEDGQHQRQPGGDERAEGEHKDRQRHRPGDELGLHHRRAVGVVEVRPHPRRAGQADRDVVRSRRLQLRLQVVGGSDHRRRITLAPAITIAVWPSAEIIEPARGGTTDAMRASARSMSLDTADRERKAGSRRSARRSGRRPSAPSWRARRSSPGSARAPRPIRNRSPASLRPRARSRRSARTRPE